MPLSRNKDKRIVGGLPNLGQPHLEFANENTRRFQKTRATEQCPKSMMFDADGVFSNLSKYPKDIVTLVLACISQCGSVGAHQGWGGGLKSQSFFGFHLKDPRSLQVKISIWGSR